MGDFPNFILKMSSDWSQDLCNCCGDCEACCCVTCCPWYQMYVDANELDGQGIECMLLHIIFPLASIFLVRQKAREKYNIEGSDMGDLCTVCCCGPCTHCQTSVEIKNRQGQ